MGELLSYDANGNILTVNRDGLKVNLSSPIDELTYSYETNSNKLQQVTDAANDPNSTLGDFHYSGTKTGTDYTYDGNGNLTSDANKQISAITYNYLNLPENITFTGKGTIAYTYDADGNKLQKVVTDLTLNPNKVTTTNYCDGFVYTSSSPQGGGQVGADTLLYMLTGEGRIRPDSASGLPAGGFTYDYFLRDHLGDVRSIITEQTNENTYAATMEPQNAQTEDQLFDNISSTTVLKPNGFDNDPNNKQVSQLDGSSGNDSQPRVGPSIVLKVMAGDTITIATQAWYSGAVEPPPSGANNLLNDLLNALTGGVITNSHGIYSSSDNNPNTVLSGDLGQFFTNDENSNYNTSAPKAFLNYVAFDDQLNMNAANSGVVQVPQIAAGAQAQALVAPEQIIQKNGYLYIYVSNESAQQVFFDNLVIHHNKGHLLEENQYYPFGLQMAGISDKALPNIPNNYLYNGKELQQNEFSDGSGLEDYDYGFRRYDPQLGRFTEQDPLTDEFATVSPYQYALNDPVANIDEDGLSPFNLLCPGTSGFTIFLMNLGDAFTHIASSPLTRVVSMAATIGNTSANVGNAIAVSNKINNLFTAVEVGGVANAGSEEVNSEEANNKINITPGPPTEWLKKILQFFGWFSQSNNPSSRWKYARRNAALNNLVHKNVQAQQDIDKYSGYIPILGGAVKMSEGMQEGRPLTVAAGMGSVGFDLFGGELFKELEVAGKGITVLGKFPDYINLASELGARRFNIPIEVWNKMTPAEQWAANVKFLDRAIARGDRFILATPVEDITKVTGYFRKELDYLISKGYKLSKEGTELIK